MIYKKENIDTSLVQCPYEEEQGYIYIGDNYTNDLLKLSGYSDISDDFFVCCSDKILINHIGDYALLSAEHAYWYAAGVVEGRFKLGEEVIATDPRYSYKYAHLLKRRFELGEKTIAECPEYSYRYSILVIKGRFELGEPTIAQDSQYSYRYACHVLRGRFELGEPAIAQDSHYSILYARDIMKGRL